MNLFILLCIYNMSIPIMSFDNLTELINSQYPNYRKNSGGFTDIIYGASSMSSANISKQLFNSLKSNTNNINDKIIIDKDMYIYKNIYKELFK